MHATDTAPIALPRTALYACAQATIASGKPATAEDEEMMDVDDEPAPSSLHAPPTSVPATKTVISTSVTSVKTPPAPIEAAANGSRKNVEENWADPSPRKAAPIGLVQVSDSSSPPTFPPFLSALSHCEPPLLLLSRATDRDSQASSVSTTRDVSERVEISAADVRPLQGSHTHSAITAASMCYCS